MNQNFEDVETEVTNNASDIASNAASISDLKINSNALTLEGRPASDFADSSHTHDSSDITPGVLPIGASAFTGMNLWQTGGGSVRANIGGPIPTRANASLTLPFKCTITKMEAEVRNNSNSSEVYVELHDGECLNAFCDTLVPIVAFDTSSLAATNTHVVISTPPLLIDYDPNNLNKYPLWVTVWLDDYAATRQKMYWVKIYYTVP